MIMTVNKELIPQENKIYSKNNKYKKSSLAFALHCYRNAKQAHQLFNEVKKRSYSTYSNKNYITNILILILVI
jgi:hypothetical protein